MYYNYTFLVIVGVLYSLQHKTNYTCRQMADKNVLIYLCSYRVYILVLTFVIYAAYHMSRKPFSVVAVSSSLLYVHVSVHVYMLNDNISCVFECDVY